MVQVEARRRRLNAPHHHIPGEITEDKFNRACSSAQHGGLDRWSHHEKNECRNA